MGLLLRASACFLGLLFFMDIAPDKAHGIHCYDCNSFHDPRCADPFDENQLGLGLVDCAQMGDNNTNYTMCRKIVQKVDGKARTKRSCGWQGDPQDQASRGCYHRAGTFEVQVLYCACVGDKCNGATLPSSPAALLILLCAFLISSRVVASPVL